MLEVHESWRGKLHGIAKPRSLEVYCNQVKRCIEIALQCLKPNRQERPTIENIISSLNETESMIGDRGLQIEQFDDGGDSVPHSMSSITSETSSEGKGETRRPNYKWNSFHHPTAVKYDYDVLQNMTDDFSKDRLIGTGRFGDVYKGVSKDGQVIAVKHFRSVDEKLFQDAFRYHVLAQHQNIVKLVGYCHSVQQPKLTIVVDSDGGIFIVSAEDRRQEVLCLEYMANGSLERYISDECSGLNWHLRYGIIKGSCEGLRYLHEELESPIIHMGLAPSTILLDENMIPKIGGIGMSKLVYKQTSLRGTFLGFPGETSLVGSVAYMPPEFIDKQVITKQYDIYSLGVVIIEIITGKRHFPKSDELSSKEFIEFIKDGRISYMQHVWAPGWKDIPNK